LASGADTAPTVGCFQFDDRALAAGNAAITAAIRDRLDVVAIDEIGPLEFRGGGWCPALEIALSEGITSQELILVVRAELVDRLADRFPGPWWTNSWRISPPWPPTEDESPV
jgi:nucleoside-triphosphatase THEP1